MPLTPAPLYTAERSSDSSLTKECFDVKPWLWFVLFFLLSCQWFNSHQSWSRFLALLKAFLCFRSAKGGKMF